MIKLQLHPDRRMLAQFAWVSPVGFALFALLFSRFGLPPAGVWTVVAIGPTVLLLHLLGVHAATRAVFRVLVLLTAPLGFVLFPLLIGLIYYGVFTPMGLLFRLLGRDAMSRSFDPKARTYWRDRPSARPASSYFKLY
jgi:hypothetical protein